MKRFLPILLLTTLVLILTVGHVTQKNIMQSPSYVLRYAENQPSDYPTTLAAKYFAALVEERTGGDVKIYVYDNAELGDEGSILKQMQRGGIDIARISLVELIPHDKELAVLTLPYLYRDEAHYRAVLEGEIGDSYLGPLSDTGLIALSWYNAGARHLYTSSQQVKTPEDLYGLTIRVQDSTFMVDLIRALGAKPKPLPYNVVYSYLSAGFIDGAENNWPSYLASQHYKSAKYLLLDGHIRIPEMQLLSAKTAEILPSSYLDIIRECAQDSAQYEWQLWSEREASAREYVEQAGVQVTELSETELQTFRARCLPLYQQYAAGQEALIVRIQNTPS